MTWERLTELFDTMKVIRISVVGLEQTGKTNNALFIANIFERLALERASIPLIVYHEWTDPKDTISRLEKLKDLVKIWCSEECNEYCPDSLFLIFDDISFLTQRLDSEMKTFLNYVSRIAHHQKWAKRIVITNIFHYSKATVPFLRISHVKIVTSIASPVEVNGLKDFFTESSLWNFFRIKTHGIKKSKYYTLYNVFGYEFITKPPRSTKPRFFFNLDTIKIDTESEEQKENLYIVEFQEKRKTNIPIIFQKDRKTNSIYVYYKTSDGKKIRILKLKPVSSSY